MKFLTKFHLFDQTKYNVCVYFFRSFDSIQGGFSRAPKFPRPVTFEFLFRIIDREGLHSDEGKEPLHMISLTLTKMGEGGMFDHLGGGFHRYSVTADWHIPQ